MIALKMKKKKNQLINLFFSKESFEGTELNKWIKQELNSFDNSEQYKKANFEYQGNKNDIIFWTMEDQHFDHKH